MCTGRGSSASWVKGCQRESGLMGILKILPIETLTKYVQERFPSQGIEPRDRADNGNSGEVLNGTFVVFVAIADHHHALDGYFCTEQGPYREQSMIDCAQRRSRGNDNGKS